MRTCLMLLAICISFNSYSQDRAEIAFRANIPTDLGKEIKMPDPGMGSFNLEQFQTVKGSKNVMVIATDSFYRKIFSRYQSDSIPVIDFRIYDLVLFSACGYCMDGCQHDKGITSCHRNACDYQRAWFVHEKSLGRVGEQVIMK